MLSGKIKDFFMILGGNSNLTEDFIYNNQPNHNDKSVRVYTGATNRENEVRVITSDSILGNGKEIKCYEGQSIKIVRKGKAGSLHWIDDSKFTINDDAYVMQVREKYSNEINLKYMLYTQNKIISNCVSSNGNGKNGTFNKTLFEESFIKIPPMREQNQIVKEYEKAQKLKAHLIMIYENIEKVIRKNPKYDHGDELIIDDVFDILSEDRRLTERFIYNYQGEYPVYSAQIDGAYGYINEYKYDREILFVVQYGIGAGKTILRNGKMNVGRNVCGLIPKLEYEEKIDLRFAKYALENIFINNSKGTDLKSLQ